VKEIVYIIITINIFSLVADDRLFRPIKITRFLLKPSFINAVSLIIFSFIKSLFTWVYVLLPEYDLIEEFYVLKYYNFVGSLLYSVILKYIYFLRYKADNILITKSMELY